MTRSDGMATTFVGLGPVYVQNCGAVSTGARDFDMYKIPDSLAAATRDGQPRPPALISLAELRSMRMEPHVAKDATYMADSVHSY